MGDDRLLEQVAALLNDSDVATTPLDSEVSPSYDALQLNTEQLLSETERLLSTLEAHDDGSSSDASSPQSLETKSELQETLDNAPLTTKNASEERKREIKSLQATIRRNRYRQKLKNERHTLLQQQHELQTQLSQLQAVRARRNADTKREMTLSVWRAVAKRQMEMRLKAEQQQKQLRAAVMYRARGINQMKTLLQMTSPAHNAGLMSGERSGVALDGAAVVRNYLLELDSLYAQTDRVLAKHEMNVATSMKYKPTKRIDDGVEYYDTADAVLIPVEFEKAANAIALVMLSTADGIRYDEGIRDPENTSAGRFVADYRDASGEQVDLVSYCVTRRYKEANRVVFVWRMLTEGQGEYRGSQADETGWVVVRPLDVESDTETEPHADATVCESYTRLVPASLARNNQVLSERFTDLVIKFGDDDVQATMKSLKGMLLGSP